jgi:hypothetical protein
VFTASAREDGRLRPYVFDALWAHLDKFRRLYKLNRVRRAHAFFSRHRKGRVGTARIAREDIRA